MRSKYMVVCMLTCNGTDVWVWEKALGVGTISGRSLVTLVGSEESPVCVLVSVTVGVSCILSERERYDRK